MGKNRKWSLAKIKEVIELHKKGISSRNICKELGESLSKKSTVNYYISEWKQGKLSLKTSAKKTKKKKEVNTNPKEDLNLLCKHPDFSISNLAKRLRSAQRTNNQLRKVQREVFDKKGVVFDQEVFLSKLEEVLKRGTPPRFYNNGWLRGNLSKKTVEVLWSDWQWGKISEHWNSDIASKASKYYGEELLKIVSNTKPEKIIFTALGDNIEDALKHGTQSTSSTDTSNAEQMANCIEQVWFNILQPLVALKIPMEFVGIAGNHGAHEHKGMDTYKAGRYCMDYTLYKAWETLCKTVNADHVTFKLPEGHFATYDIYGKLTVAEHGYNCKGSSENAMIALRNKRSVNLQKYVHRLVIGDMHHYCNYDNGNLQVNGAAFGVAFDAIEYSGIMGFHAIPAQIVNIHEPTTGVGQNTVVETKVIQVAKGYDYKDALL